MPVSTPVERSTFDPVQDSSAVSQPPAARTGSNGPFHGPHSTRSLGIPSETEILRQALLRTAVVIPARNEEDSITNVLRDLPEVGVVIVADNGSTDATAALARDASCVVVYEKTPGYGRACLAGLGQLDEYIAEKQTNQGGSAQDAPIEFVAFLDADYSDHPEQLANLLTPIVQDEADFVLGSRLMGKLEPGAMPPQAVFGNWLACFLMKCFWGTSFTDLGPFRVIRRESLQSLNMSDQNFGWTVEMQIKAIVAGLRTIEISVPYRHRIGVSKISGTVSGTIRAGYKILYTIGKYAWQTKFRRA